MDNHDQQENENAAEINRILKEKAKQGFEFGKPANQNQHQKDSVHIGPPKSNHTGIDRGRWAD